nr:hypothetical protein [Desulfobulbaceae bacterium]
MIYSNISYGSVGQTDYTIEQASFNDFYQKNPTINDIGDLAWQGRPDTVENDYEIFIRPAGSAIATQITDNSYQDTNPRLNDLGDVVWEGLNGDYEIFLYSGGITTQLTDNDRPDFYPQISNTGDISWMGRDGIEDDWEIFKFSPATPDVIYQITDNDTDDQHPRINANGDIVWLAFGSEIGIYTFEAATQQISKLSDATYGGGHYDSLPTINDQGKITWYGWDGSGFEIFLASPPGAVHDDVFFEPQTLNLKSRGQGFTTYINFKGGLPEILASEIDTETVRITMVGGESLTERIAPLPSSDFEIVDFDNDGVLEMKVKFDRQAVIAAVKPLGSGMVDISIGGKLLSGATFTGVNTIKVIDSKESKVNKSKAKISKISKISKVQKANNGKQLGKNKK